MQMQTENLSIIAEPPGGVSIGGLNNFWDLPHLNGKFPDYKSVPVQLLKEHEAIILSLRKNIDACDEKTGNHSGTSNFLIRLMKQHQAIVDILKSYMDKAMPNKNRTPDCKTDMMMAPCEFPSLNVNHNK